MCSFSNAVPILPKALLATGRAEISSSGIKSLQNTLPALLSYQFNAPYHPAFVGGRIPLELQVKKEKK